LIGALLRSVICFPAILCMTLASAWIAPLSKAAEFNDGPFASGIARWCALSPGQFKLYFVDATLTYLWEVDPVSNATSSLSLAEGQKGAPDYRIICGGDRAGVFLIGASQVVTYNFAEKDVKLVAETEKMPSDLRITEWLESDRVVSYAVWCCDYESTTRELPIRQSRSADTGIKLIKVDNDANVLRDEQIDGFVTYEDGTVLISLASDQYLSGRVMGRIADQPSVAVSKIRSIVSAGAIENLLRSRLSGQGMVEIVGPSFGDSASPHLQVTALLRNNAGEAVEIVVCDVSIERLAEQNMSCNTLPTLKLGIRLWSVDSLSQYLAIGFAKTDKEICLALISSKELSCLVDLGSLPEKEQQDALLSSSASFLLSPDKRWVALFREDYSWTHGDDTSDVAWTLAIIDLPH
jgi:hypothetical protein